MVTLRNLGNQELELIFKVEGEWLHHYLSPRDSVTVPKSFLTNIVLELTKRKLLSLKTL